MFCLFLCELSRVCLFETPWTVACQTLSLGFPRQEYLGGFLFPFPGDLPDSGVKLASPAWQEDSFTTWEASASGT